MRKSYQLATRHTTNSFSLSLLTCSASFGQFFVFIFVFLFYLLFCIVIFLIFGNLCVLFLAKFSLVYN